jgi:8-oxo-dGTP pyrophosphatase MutT (NUDIX family)
VGGRIRQGESSAEAARRECLEETGCPLEPERLVFVQERFYHAGGSEHHEVVFFYLMQGDTSSFAPGAGTDQAEESLCWVPLSALPYKNLYPSFLKTALQALPQEMRQIITRE